MNELYLFAPVAVSYEPHPLLPEGYELDAAEVVVETPWEDFLPPRSFSSTAFGRLQDLAASEYFEEEQAAVTLARYLEPKISFQDEFGCWELPLRQEYDSKKRARYPCITVTSLGYKNQLAHRASMEVFRGVELPRNADEPLHVDHRCRNHACCNPYHLDAVSHAENVRRGRRATANERSPSLFGFDRENQTTIGKIAAIATVSADSE